MPPEKSWWSKKVVDVNEKEKKMKARNWGHGDSGAKVKYNPNVLVLIFWFGEISCCSQIKKVYLSLFLIYTDEVLNFTVLWITLFQSFPSGTKDLSRLPHLFLFSLFMLQASENEKNHQVNKLRVWPLMPLVDRSYTLSSWRDKKGTQTQPDTKGVRTLLIIASLFILILLHWDPSIVGISFGRMLHHNKQHIPGRVVSLFSDSVSLKDMESPMLPRTEGQVEAGEAAEA